MPAPSTPGALYAEPQAKLDITIPAHVDCIAGVVDKVVALARQLHGESGKEHEIALALTEALVNAIKHGSKNDPSLTVRCQAVAEGSALTIIVSDSGSGFDPSSVANPLESAGLYAVHGRGLYMIRQLMDGVDFARRGAEIRMTKRF